MRWHRQARGAAAAALLAAAALTPAGCAGRVAPAADGRVSVVAAESFWGSLAAQLGGSRVSVRSIVARPGTDPHSYEPTAADARKLASAQLVVENGIGYDPWVTRLLRADEPDSPRALDVGRLLSLKQGDNPHQWYSPTAVQRVIDQLTADLRQLDPADAAYFARRRAQLGRRGLAAYHHLISTIRARYAGVAVGYSESVFAPLGLALGLRLLTPYGFARSVAEGTDVSAADKQTVDRQAQQRQIRVWVYNRQNDTPDVQRVTGLVRAAGIPVTSITETPTPASASFQSWQVAQLRELQRALHQATGR